MLGIIQQQAAEIQFLKDEIHKTREKGRIIKVEKRVVFGKAERIEKRLEESPSNYLFARTEPLADTKCILCGLCVRVCAEITQRHAISFIKKGMKRKVITPFGKISETCIGCGACACLPHQCHYH
ncbi:MAG: 4Fe-4S dicluster domain-containing protein [bacterium]